MNVKAIGTITGIIGLFGLAILYGALTWGFIFYKFYYWFVLPVFTDLPLVNFWQCIGLMFFIGLFKNTDVQKTNEKQAWVSEVFGPWFALFVAWLFTFIIY